MTTLFYKLHTFESSMRIVLTVLSLRLLTKPMDRPWPPEQLLLVKVLIVPELMAKQPSWMYVLVGDNSLTLVPIPPRKRAINMEKSAKLID